MNNNIINLSASVQDYRAVYNCTLKTLTVYFENQKVEQYFDVTNIDLARLIFKGAQSTIYKTVLH